MEAKCRRAMERYHMLRGGESLIVGLSGGADSCALLHFLCSLREEYALHLTAVHVNHMIRGEEAERDAAFAEQFCRELCVPFCLYTRNVPAIAAEKGIGLEECGREIRYAIFEEAAERLGGKIATAHTLSDSVETVLFHIIRGCSLGGLKGIPPVRGRIIRPLILCERADVEAYCARHGIRYRTDSTNSDTDYARNKIRLRLLPLMREMNPSVNEAIGRLSEAACEDDAYLSGQAERVADGFLSAGSADMLFSEKRPVVSRALMRICEEKLHIRPEQKHVLAMLEAVARGEGSVPLPGGHLFTVKGKIVAFTNRKNFPETEGASDSAGQWRAAFAAGEIITPYGQKIKAVILEKNTYNEFIDKNNEKFDEKVFKNCLDYDTIEQAVFRFRAAGDRFSPAGRGCSKSLKKLLNEAGIPVAVRGRLPLLECGGSIAWICAIGAAERFKVTSATARVLYLDADSINA